MSALAIGLFRCAGRAVAVREHVAGATLRNILRMAVGEKWADCYGSAEGEAFRRTLDEAFAVTGAVSNVGEWIPAHAPARLAGLHPADEAAERDVRPVLRADPR